MLPVSRYHHIRSGGKASTIAQDTQSLTHHRFIVRLGHGGQHASRPKADLYKKAAEPHHITRQSAPPSWRERRSEAHFLSSSLRPTPSNNTSRALETRVGAIHDFRDRRQRKKDQTRHSPIHQAHHEKKGTTTHKQRSPVQPPVREPQASRR